MISPGLVSGANDMVGTGGPGLKCADKLPSDLEPFGLVRGDGCKLPRVEER